MPGLLHRRKRHAEGGEGGVVKGLISAIKIRILKHGPGSEGVEAEELTRHHQWDRRAGIMGVFV